MTIAVQWEYSNPGKMMLELNYDFYQSKAGRILLLWVITRVADKLKGFIFSALCSLVIFTHWPVKR